MKLTDPARVMELLQENNPSDSENETEKKEDGTPNYPVVEEWIPLPNALFRPEVFVTIVCHQFLPPYEQH